MSDSSYEVCIVNIVFSSFGLIKLKVPTCIAGSSRSSTGQLVFRRLLQPLAVSVELFLSIIG